MTNTIRTLTCILACSVLLMIAISEWASDSHRLQLGQESMNWPSTKATITAASVSTVEHHSKGSTWYTYLPIVQYKYKVHGKFFTGNRLWYVGETDKGVSTKEAAEQSLADYRVGSVHNVRYSPKTPGEVVMHAGIDADHGELNSLKTGSLALMVLLMCLAGLTGGPGEQGMALAFVACIPGVLMLLCTYFMQGEIIRHLVPPSAVVRVAAR